MATGLLVVGSMSHGESGISVTEEARVDRSDGRRQGEATEVEARVCWYGIPDEKGGASSKSASMKDGIITNDAFEW